jgi:two-component system cell cycle response regulator
MGVANMLDPNNHTILLAEDSQTQGRGLKSLLEAEGFKVYWFKNGEDTLRWALSSDEMPSIIISDVMMPRMDGFELCRRIKEDQRTHNIPVILLTALTDPVEVINGLKAGADNFIVKPSTPDNIIKQVLSLINYSLTRPSGNEAQVVLEINVGDQVHKITAQKMQIVNLIFSLVDSSSQSARQLNDLLTRQEELERDARNLRDNLYNTMAMVDDGILVASTSGEVLYVNPAGEMILRSAGWTGGMIPFATNEEEKTELHVTLPSGDAMVLDVKIGITSWGSQEARVITMRDVTELCLLRDQLKLQAITDPLTGLLNRRGFIGQAREVLSEARKSGETCFMAYMDLDGFKRINDTHGHFEGDRILKLMGKIMMHSFRGADLMCRWGGDEFVIMVHGYEGISGFELFDNFVMRFQSTMAFTEEYGTPVGLSFGFEELSPTDTRDLEEIIDELDRKMYAHKQGKEAQR